jgi:catechol 2,3-dioxygenase-like lactoylglutathione lyase family enzyme
MLGSLDHLVIVVRDLAAAAKRYESLGFTVVPGGRHPVGTHNALIAFPDGAYLELIAFYEPSPLHKWWPALQQGGGLVDFCVQTDDLPADTVAFRRAGVEIDDPAPLSRIRPDGYRLRWVLSIPRGGARGVAPFLIEDETPRDERVPRQVRHDNGVTGIATVTVAVSDLTTVRGWYAAVLGQAGHEVVRDDLAATGTAFTLGAHRLEIVTPRAATSPLQSWLGRRGPSPYAATLTTTAAARGPLDPALTEGARLSLV